MLIDSEMVCTNFPFEAVLWDMDGTLIDSEPIWISQERELMESLGVTWSDADAIHCIGGPMTRVDAYMRNKLNQHQKALHPPMTLTKLLLERMERELPKAVSYAPGSEALLKQLQSLSIPQALVSASSRALVDAGLSFIGTEVFGVSISNDDVEFSKPNPEGYRKAAQSLGVDIANCLILEDSVTGITAAIDSGAYVLGIPHVTQLPTAEKVVHRKTLADLDLAGLVNLFATVKG
jgi:HAD superfamily hydrolase (TIGR01509 family)